jgi:hypothetical protein
MRIKAGTPYFQLAEQFHIINQETQLTDNQIVITRR